MDNRHHYQDVTIGSLLGLFLSFFAYRQYYPPLSSSHSEKPFEPRFLNLRGSMSVGHHSPRTDGQEELDLNRTRNTAGRSDGERYADDEGEEDVGASRVWCITHMLGIGQYHCWTLPCLVLVARIKLSNLIHVSKWKAATDQCLRTITDDKSGETYEYVRVIGTGIFDTHFAKAANSSSDVSLMARRESWVTR